MCDRNVEPLRPRCSGHGNGPGGAPPGWARRPVELGGGVRRRPFGAQITRPFGGQIADLPIVRADGKTTPPRARAAIARFQAARAQRGAGGLEPSCSAASGRGALVAEAAAAPDRARHGQHGARSDRLDHHAVRRLHELITAEGGRGALRGSTSGRRLLLRIEVTCGVLAASSGATPQRRPEKACQNETQYTAPWETHRRPTAPRANPAHDALRPGELPIARRRANRGLTKAVEPSRFQCCHRQAAAARQESTPRARWRPF